MSAPAWAVHVPPGVQPDLAEGTTLPGAFTKSWAADPSRVTLSTMDGERVAAAELEDRTGLAALRYAAAGLVPGDRVLLSAANSIELVVAYVGALRAGLTVVPANPAYPAAELGSLVATARPSLAVLDDLSRLGGHDIACTPPTLEHLPRRGSGLVLDAAAPNDPALIIYTSGTTGMPKGAPLTHANLLASAHAVRLAWRWTPDDTLALSLPLFHMHGLGVGLHGTLVTGASAVLAPFAPETVAAAIDGGASMFFGVPTMYHRIAGSPHLAALRGLRLAVSGSAPLPAELHAAVREGSGQAVLERYGMTETAMLASNPYEGQRRPGTVGFPLPGVQLRLSPRESRADLAGSARPQTHGAGRDGGPVDGGTAEIEVRGPNVIDGYLDNPAATAEAFTADGWFRTGDLGTLDADGYLTISGRAKELIITGGYNVYPREVEEVLLRHPGVVDAAVVGLASERWGETVAAFVVPAGEGIDGLAEWCAAQLVDYKRPREWYLVPAIPRNALGKILRHELRPS